MLFGRDSMNGNLLRSFSLAVLVSFFSLGGCSKAPELVEEEVVERLPQREREKTNAEIFAESDADQDGRLSSEELPSKFLLKWDLIDMNADGYIDADEQHAYLNPRGAEVVMEEKPATETKEEPESERRAGGLDQFLATTDTDGDGRISMAEAPGKMQERFTMLDANGDGFIDGDEQAALAKRVKNKEGKKRKQGGKGGFNDRSLGGGGIEQMFPFDIQGGGRGAFGGGGKKDRK